MSQGDQAAFETLGSEVAAEVAARRAQPRDLDRARASQHLSYGHGAHRCAGSALAELELSVLAKALLKHEFRLGGPVGYGFPTSAGSVLGFRDVPLTVRA